MRLCRFNENRLGVLDEGTVKDVSRALDVLPALRWPIPHGDALIAHLPAVISEVRRLLPSAPAIPSSTVRLLSPVANPSKIIAAPLNYKKHVEEVARDPQIHAGRHSFTHEGYMTPVDKLGLFLKANTSLIGPSEGIRLVYPDRRTDHEIELVAVIGREVKDVPPDRALDYVCAYSIGLDMTVRGPEDRSFRKSPDTYTVIGPVLVTADEVDDPSSLSLALSVNGVERQRASTADLTVGIAKLISIAASCYTLYPGDLIMTGTPDGVGEVHSGDELVAQIDQLGELRVAIHSGPIAEQMVTPSAASEKSIGAL